MQNLPLSDARHISILVDGVPSRSTCGQLSQLEVHQLLHSRWCGDIPRGFEWKFGTSVGHPAQATTL